MNSADITVVLRRVDQLTVGDVMRLEDRSAPGRGLRVWCMVAAVEPDDDNQTTILDVIRPHIEGRAVTTMTSTHPLCSFDLAEVQVTA